MPRPDFNRTMSLNALNLRFRDAEVENAFKESWLNAIWLVRVIWVVTAAVVYAFYSALILQASSYGLGEMHWFRIFVCLPLLLIVVGMLLTKAMSYRHFDIVFPLVSCVVFANACYSYAFSEGMDSLLFLYEMATSFVFTMSYFPALFRPILSGVGINTAVSFVTFWYVWLSAGQAWPAIVVQTLLLMGLALTGLFAAYSKDILIRRNYRAVMKAREDQVQAERLAEAANAASEAKSRFVAMVGHEFRTPLNAVMGYSEILQMRTGQAQNDPRVAEYVRDILDSARRLHRLVENVLAISTGPDQELTLSLEQVDLTGVVPRALKLCQQQADAAGVTCRMAMGAERLTLTADGWMLSYMLDELLTNALKFTPKGGQISVNVVSHPDGAVDLSVADNGIGMADEKISQIFDPFFQVDDTLSRSGEGLGLGLTLVRKMMDAHGGRIAISSTAGAGTTVTLSFPWHALAPTTGRAQQSPATVRN